MSNKLIALFIIPLIGLISCFPARKAKSANPSPMSAEARLREDISGYAHNFIGVKYRSAGLSPKSGFDCSGFTTYVMKEFDINLQRSSTGQATMGRSITKDEVQPGDLVYFARSGRIFHVALVVENSSEGIIVVHSTSSSGVVRENITTSDYWRPKIKGYRDILSDRSF